MADWMAKWMFSYNIPMVMNNFFYTIMILTTIFGVLTGIMAARYLKRMEEFAPKDEEYEAKLAERKSAKAMKKGGAVEEIVEVVEA